MQSPSRFATFLQLIMIGVLVTSISACTMVEGREKPSAYFDDAGISNKIRADIVADKKLSVFQIHVETMQGVVQLSGFVDSSDTEAHAVHVAENVEGVKMVKDNLVVR
jgi:osmotically-inducible protein OsmY